jgi:Flp pilus assembly protein TadG
MIGRMSVIAGALRDTKGVAAIQFAFVAPVLILMLLGIIDMGRLGMTVSTMRNAAIEAARYASMRGAESPTPATVAAITDFAKDRAVGVPSADIAVAVTWFPDNKSGSQVKVQLNYNFEMFVSWLTPLPTIQLAKSSAMTIF